MTDSIQDRIDAAIHNHEDRLHAPEVYDGGFEAFWDAYPSRGRHPNPKKPALFAWRSAVKHGAKPEDIIHGAKCYAAYVRNDNVKPQLVCHARTWLNQERWKQYLQGGSSEAPSAEYLPPDDGRSYDERYAEYVRRKAGLDAPS